LRNGTRILWRNSCRSGSCRRQSKVCGPNGQDPTSNLVWWSTPIGSPLQDCCKMRPTTGQKWSVTGSMHLHPRLRHGWCKLHGEANSAPPIVAAACIHTSLTAISSPEVWRPRYEGAVWFGSRSKRSIPKRLDPSRIAPSLCAHHTSTRLAGTEFSAVRYDECRGTLL